MTLRMLRPAAIVLVAALARAFESPISSGVTFPDLSGKSLAGNDITVGMKDGQPKVVVMTFTRAAANPAQTWLDACRADESAKPAPSSPGADSAAPAPPASRVACYDVRMAQETPRVVRGFLEGRMKKGLSQEQLTRTVLVYKHEEAWRDRLVVMEYNEKEPFVVFVDRHGRVQSLLQGPFNAAALKAEQGKLLLN